jgi:hypothetical protein
VETASSIELFDPEADSDVTPSATAVFDRIPADKAERDRARRREQKLATDATRPMDAWERYRALVDASDEAYELIDISNREARFALILMGALNAAAFVLLTRADALGALAPQERQWLAGLFAGYIVMALAFLMQAIEALRPGRIRPSFTDWPDAPEERPVLVRYYEDVITRTSAEHWQLWQEVRLSQLSAELAAQVHSLSVKNNLKHIALGRLYFGLRAMAIVLTLLMLLSGWLVWM